MKKFASVFLTAIILIMSALSVNAFAQENHFPLSEMEAVITYSVNGEEETVAKLYLKGEKLAFISDLPLTETISIKIKLIVDDGKSYLLFPNFPFVYLELEDVEYDLNDITNAEGMTLVKSGEITQGNTTYYVEEYSADDGSTYKIYFIGDEFVKTEVSYTDEYGNLTRGTTEIVSYEVDDSVFRILWFSADLTPILSFFFESGIM